VGQAGGPLLGLVRALSRAVGELSIRLILKGCDVETSTFPLARQGGSAGETDRWLVPLAEPSPSVPLAGLGRIPDRVLFQALARRDREAAVELRRTCLAHQLTIIDEQIYSESPDAVDLVHLRPQIVQRLAELGPAQGG
jgi:hypothetical protein